MSDQPTQPSQVLTTRERMVRIPAVGYRGQLAAAAADLYTAPTANSNMPTNATDLATAEVRTVSLCNTDSSDRTVTLYAVESGGTTAAARALVSGATVKAGQTIVMEWPEDGFPLASGEKVRGLASVADKVTVRIAVRVIAYAA